MRALVIAGVVVFELAGIFVLLGVTGEHCRWSDCDETLRLIVVAALWAVPALAFILHAAAKAKK